MKAVWHIAVKDIRMLFADKASAFFAIGWPIMIAVLFGTVFSGAGSGDWALYVGVVDEDQTEQSAAFVQELSEAEELVVTQATRAEAAEKVRKGEWTAYVILPPGFGEAREHPFRGLSAEMEIGIDPSRKAEGAMLQGVLMKHMFSSFEEMFTDRDRMRSQMAEARQEVEQADDMDPVAQALLAQFLGAVEQLFDQMPETADFDMSAWQPFDMEQTDVVRRQEGPRSPFEVTFPQGLSWAFICSAAVFGISLVVERVRGTLLRLQAAPLGRMHILGGKGLACFLTTSFVSALMLGIGASVFGIRPSSWLLLILAVGSTAVCFTGIMMVVSTLGRTEQSAAAFAWPIFMVMAMTGGGMMPLAMMPGWLRAISDFSPLKWGVLALEGAIWREFSLGEMLMPCGILVAVGVCCFALGVRLFRWEQEA